MANLDDVTEGQPIRLTFFTAAIRPGTGFNIVYREVRQDLPDGLMKVTAPCITCEQNVVAFPIGEGRIGINRDADYTTYQRLSQMAFNYGQTPVRADPGVYIIN